MTNINSKVFHYLLLGGIFVLPLVAFIVPGNMFFPYITGKNFFFRIAVELLGALWLALLVIDKSYRPKISPLLYALTATILVLIISTIFGANPSRSFWSNYERMEGLVGHLHLFVYFLILIGTLKREVEWRWFLYANAAAGAVMAVYGWLQYFGAEQISVQSGQRIDGTFGNATYMAIFMVFQIFLAVYLLLSSDKRSVKWAFGALMILEIPVVFLTATRGAILGLLGGAIISAILFAVFGGWRQRRIAFGILGSIVVMAVIFLSVRNTNFATNNYILQRFQNISLKERTVESRLTIWKMSFEGFQERPILGWGLENYNQVFNKYFNPVLWRQEPWFDRSHNVFFDWLTAGGLAGLMTYLSIFGAAIYMLWKKAGLGGSNYDGLNRAAIFTAMFAAYFMHNIFVFDNLISYLLFFTMLGYVHFIYIGGKEEDVRRDALSFGSAISEAVYPFAATGVVIALAFIMYFINVKPLLANYALLNALQDISRQGGKADLILADFDKVFAYNTFGSSEAREQLAGYANNILRSNLSAADKERVYTMTIREFEKQVAENPRDVRAHLVLSSLYSDIGRNNEALAAVQRALALSPKKQQIYFMLADIYMRAGDNGSAVKAMQTAYDFDPAYTDAAMGLAVTEIIAGRTAEAEAVLKNAFGDIVIADQKLINAYARVGNYARVRDIWLKFIGKEPQNYQYHVNLAATYLHIGERDKSVLELEEAIKLNPQFQKQGEYYIGEIKAGRNP